MRNALLAFRVPVKIPEHFGGIQVTTIVHSPARILLFAFAAGAMIANMYYLQPILGLASSSFNEPVSTTGLLVGLGPIGYTLGILMIVPLGDVLERRTLLALMFGINAIALLTVASSTSFTIFSVAVLISGATSSAAMLIVPFVALHCARGKARLAGWVRYDRSLAGHSPFLGRFGRNRKFSRVACTVWDGWCRSDCMSSLHDSVALISLFSHLIRNVTPRPRTCALCKTPYETWLSP